MALKTISKVSYDVKLIPQSLAGNCAFACMAMVLNYKKLLDLSKFASTGMAVEYLDNCTNLDNLMCSVKGYKPSLEASRNKGFQTSPEQFTGIDSMDSNRTFSRLGFMTETRIPTSASMLYKLVDIIKGPLIYNSMGITNIDDSHFRVITGMDYIQDDNDKSDENDINSLIYLNDPYEKGLNKFTSRNKGSKYSITYMEFVSDTLKLLQNERRLKMPPGKSIFFAYHL